METKERRESLLQGLTATPASASFLARQYGVSRQVIVGDIAILRAAGNDVVATPRGYIFERRRNDATDYRVLTCKHGPEQLGAELYAFVDNGATLLDVIVEHAVYGQIQCGLRLSSRYDCDRFMEKLKNESAMPLSGLTGGLHYHTLLCPDESRWQKIVSALKELQIYVDG